MFSSVKDDTINNRKGSTQHAHSRIINTLAAVWNTRSFFTDVYKRQWEGYMEKVEEIRHQTGMKEIYQKRKETIERVFADGKEKHGMRYTQYRGLAKVTMELTLLFACMNLKKLAIWKWRKGGLRNPCSFVWIFEPIYLYIKFKMVPGASHQEPFCLQSESGEIPTLLYTPHLMIIQTTRCV